MSVTDQLCEEEIHCKSCAGVHASIPVADALRLSERTKLPVVLEFNGKTVRISFNLVVDELTQKLFRETVNVAKP